MCTGCVLKAFCTIVLRLMNLLNRHHWSQRTQHWDIYTSSRLVTSPQSTGQPTLWCSRWSHCAARCLRSLLDFPHWCHKTAYFICWTLRAVVYGPLPAAEVWLSTSSLCISVRLCECATNAIVRLCRLNSTAETSKHLNSWSICQYL